MDDASTEAAKPGPDETPLEPASTVWRALGEVAAILSVSPAYKFYTLADLEWMVMPALQAKQCRLAHKGPRPVGVVLWAMLDEETASHMMDPRFRLRPDQWTCGDQVWITDVVHTGGSDPALTNAMLQDVKTTLAAGGLDVERRIHVRPIELVARLVEAASRTGQPAA